MNKYLKKCPKTPSFTQDGFNGFSFELNNPNISVDIEDVYKGHEKYCENIISTSIYYVISGSGIFKINSEKFEVSEGDLIEIPPHNNFVFVGTMKLLLIMNPSYVDNEEIIGNKNDLY